MKASVFIATSLDGFIARLDGGLDWLPVNGGEPHGYDEFMATVDALVIGRKTLETVLAFDAWPYGKKTVVVLSATLSELKAPEGAVCELMNASPNEIVNRLTQRGMNHLYIDGGVTYRDS
jgi:dihydrofolate reductase